MVENETRDMANRFGPNGVSASVLGARTNNHQVCSPFGRNVHDFALWTSLLLQCFRAGKMAEPLIQDVLSGRSLGPPHLLFPWRRWSWLTQKTLAHVLDIVSRARIGHKEHAKSGGLSAREHFCRLAYLFDVSAVQTT
jgi:hypothetical protein